MLLPTSVQQIAEVIGRDAALCLVKRLPRAYTKGHPSGQPILYVPKSIAPDHPLVEILGYQDAQRLARAFGGEILYPAACVDIDRATRNREILRLLREGRSESEVGRLFGLTVRHVQNVRREIAPEGTGDQTPQDSPRVYITAVAT